MDKNPISSMMKSLISGTEIEQIRTKVRCIAETTLGITIYYKMILFYYHLLSYRGQSLS